MTIITPALLKNHHNFLPIDLSKITRIAVIGTLAKQFKIDNTTIFSVLKKAANIEAEFAYTDGHLNTNEVNETVMNEAQRAASIADVAVIFVGFTNEKERKKATNLPTPQNVLVDVISQVNTNVVVVVLADVNIKMPWKKQVKSILQSTQLDNGFTNLLFKIDEK